MERIGVVKPIVYLKLLNYLGVPSVLVYFLFMCIKPWFYGDWGYVQGGWHDWQSLNTGMLAFISSITAFYISKYGAEQQRQRDFVASRAVLPQKLCVLCEYLKLSSRTLLQAHYLSNNQEQINDLHVPDFPIEHADVFKECIRHSTPEIGEYLANLLNKLQVHHSRITTLCKNPIFNRGNYNSNFYGVAEIQALIDNLFSLARGETNTITITLDKESIDTAYRILNIFYESYDGLEKFTIKELSKQ